MTKAAWLAENLMKWHVVERRRWDYAARKPGDPWPWWANKENTEGKFPVDPGPGPKHWDPFKDIVQAKMVQREMRALGWAVHIHQKGDHKTLVVLDAPDNATVEFPEWVEAESDTEAEAICEAAYLALEGDDG